MCNILHKKRLICKTKLLIRKNFVGFLKGTRFDRQKTVSHSIQNDQNVQDKKQKN